MSFGSNPPSSNPGFNPASNPYAANQHLGQRPPDHSGKHTQLIIAGSFILAMAAITLLFALLGAAANLMGMNPNAAPPPNMPEAQKVGFIMGQIGGTAVMILFQCIAIAGGIAMIRRKGHALAITGASVSLIPLCGPCFGLSIPFAIWALILLLRPEVKSLFS